MKGKTKKLYLLVLAVISIALLAGSLLTPGMAKHESIQEAMKDAVLHESNRIALFGMEVNPALLSDLILVGTLLLAAVLIRLFVIPKFKDKPGRFQLLLEAWVGLFTGMAKENSPHRNQALGGYIFFAGSWIFISTCFELLGIQGVTTEGASISLPAPLSDINGAIAMGVMSFLFILIGGIVANGARGAGSALKEFSLPISMSFRLFGALLSGLMVTELVYYTISLSILLPVFVGIMFTLIHAVIQAYVLTMLTSVFYGEVTEPPHPKAKAEHA